MLLTGRGRLYLSADLGGANSCVSNEPVWWPASKIDARRLAPYLEARDSIAVEV